MKDLEKCPYCEEPFREMDKIIRTDQGKVFHKDCVTLVPASWSVFEGETGLFDPVEDFVGETTNNELYAYEFLDKCQYLDEEEE